VIRVLLYSPDQKLFSLLSAALKPEFLLTLVPNKALLTQLTASDRADVLLLDFDSNHASLPEHLAFYDEISDCPLPIVIMTDDTRQSIATEFLTRGAFDWIRKPPSLVEFKVIVARAHEHARMKADLEKMRQTMSLTYGCDQLVGSSGRSQLVYDLIRRVANLSAFVLITGESGTGKELVARAIHNIGSRAKQPFVAVSCGAIPESLIESELFGSEKGAYTGSNGARAGYLEQARDGTLFLDEIGELSPNTQVKLLRVLQQREFSRLGGNKVIPLGARVLFATHRNLQEMVDAGSFRRDLFFRVNVMTISVPALRDRTEDIPMLARHFLKRYATEYDKPVNDIRPNAMELLVEYEWPGNIRELENVIQGAVILADGDSISRAELPEHLQRDVEEIAVVDNSEGEGFEQLLRQYKIRLANNAINECNGNKSLAARKLRVSRAYLHRLIRTPERDDDMEIASA
jgi:DNA-binding NtrC family response regulator